MGGVIPIGWTDAASSLQLIRSDAIEPLAISGMKRVPLPFRLCPHATDRALGAAPSNVAAQE
jgi:hypothetical protein